MNNEQWWYLSSRAMTVAVRTNAADVIQETPPIVRKFRFQPLGNLSGWMNKQGGFTMQKMRDRPRSKGDPSASLRGPDAERTLKE